MTKNSGASGLMGLQERPLQRVSEEWHDRHSAGRGQEGPRGEGVQTVDVAHFAF